MPDLFSAVREAFSRAGWQYRAVEGREVLEADFEAHHTKVCLHVQVFAELHVVSVVAEAVLREAGGLRLARVAELLMRANKELSLGAFEMDWDAAKMFFRVSNIFPPGVYDAEIIASLVHTTVVEMDRITPCVSVLEKTPAEALAGLSVARLLEREDLLPATGKPGA